MFSLLLRNLFFTILQPGLITGLFPYLLLRNSGKDFFPGAWTVLHFAGAALMIFGFLILMICILRYASSCNLP